MTNRIEHTHISWTVFSTRIKLQKFADLAAAGYSLSIKEDQAIAQGNQHELLF